MRTAILVDGAFFLKRYQRLRGQRTAEDAANDLHAMCRAHLQDKHGNELAALYRIFYYDCPPLEKKAHNPVNRKAIDFSRTPLAVWRRAFLRELKRKRKVAVRLGYLNDRSGFWDLREEVLADLLSGKRSLTDLTEDDVKYVIQQKGVDMRLGLDIASLAFKQQGESDHPRGRRQRLRSRREARQTRGYRFHTRSDVGAYSARPA